MLPDHSSLLDRLKSTANKLDRTDFAFDQTDSSRVTVTDPWGQVYVVQAPSDGSNLDAGIQDIPLPCAPGTAAAIGAFYEQVYKVQWSVPPPQGLVLQFTLNALLFDMLLFTHSMLRRPSLHAECN